METLFIPTENDFKRWVKEAVQECLQEILPKESQTDHQDGLDNRKEIAKFLRISLPTLTDWIKRGLPSHKQRGRVYFMKKEVIEYIQANKKMQFKFGSRFEKLNQQINNQ